MIKAPSVMVAGTPADFTTRVQAVTAVAAQHAASVDSAARFPEEAFAAVKSQRLLGILVPERFGGEGAALAQVADVCYQLARSCASTGMIYAMHQIKTACILRHMRDSQALERLLRRLCAEQLLLASSTTARRSSDAAASDQVLVAFLKDDYTLTRLQGWNTLGMRGTCSEGYTLKASGAADQIVPDPYEIIHPQTMVPCAHLLWGSVWTGVAADATARAQAFIRQVVRQSGGQTPPGAPQYTRSLASLRTLRGMLASSLRAYQRSMDDPKALASLEFQTMITLTKVEASELAVSIVLSAMRACGLSGYRCDSEFSIERHLRDVLSAPIMINNDRILTNLGSSSLLAPIAASIGE